MGVSESAVVPGRWGNLFAWPRIRGFGQDGSAAGEKWLFDALYPNSKGRHAGSESIRITDLCNLPVRTCGQWGEGDSSSV